jgi:N6-L-threonylcarbamoyladenine synthase
VNVLGLETSCDETSAAVVVDGPQIRSNIVSSQIDLHRPYGGVVPELAARNHLQLIEAVLREALDTAGVGMRDIDAVAGTYGPGLASSLLIGLNVAKGLAFAAGKPFIGINHLEAHLYSPDATTFPQISLIVSGGHTILCHTTGLGQFRVLGQTMDDAAGEAFDKVAKLLKLGYPGGPEIDRLAQTGNPAAIAFPRSLLDEPGYQFSFSGLKTSVLYYLRKAGRLDDWKNPESSNHLSSQPSIPDICASFQEAVVDVLVGKMLRAADEFGVRNLTASGGVSINRRFRQRLTAECDRRGYRLALAPAALCTDNAGMIASLAWHKLQAGPPSDLALEVAPSVGLGIAA